MEEIIRRLLAPLILLLWAPLLIFSAPLAALPSTPNVVGSSYPAIFVFGDSFSDTGNGFLVGLANRTAQWPYGETFPGWPAYRFSDGHVLVDLLASHLGLPFLNPYLNSSADFGGGVNYAMAVATAINASYLTSVGVLAATNCSLDVQLSWHLDLQAKVASSKGKIPGLPADTSFTEGLYVFEIGANDYIISYIYLFSPSFVISTLLPLVIGQIGKAAETLLATGARHFLFIGTTPLGCSPAVLAWADGVKDDYGCLEEHNFASYLHNELLKEEVTRLRVSYPNASFLYMDYYGAYTHILQNSEMFGFSETIVACCGAGENFLNNFNPFDACNVDSVVVCAEPSKYMIWDGNHCTDSFNLQIFNQTFITGSYFDTQHAIQ